MATYSDVLWQEEEERRKAAGLPPQEAGRTIPELLGSAARAIYGWGARLAEPRVDPYTASMLEPSMPGMIPPTPPPTEQPVTSPMDQWAQFVGAGGTQMKFQDGTSIKYKAPVSAAEKAQTAQQKKAVGTQGGQPPIPGVPVQPQPIAPIPTAPQPTGIPTTPEQERAAGYYAPRFPVGQAPMTPQDWANKRLALLKQERIEQEQLLQQAHPSRGEMLAQGYRTVAKKYGKGTRIAMAILNQDPFYTDKLAAAEAVGEAEYRKALYSGMVKISDAEYLGKMTTLDKLRELQEVERTAAAKDLQHRLELNPALKKNSAFARDWVVNKLGVSEDRADQYLKDHFNPTTGEYEIVKDPYQERLIIAKNGAQFALQILPDLPKETALAAGLDPGLIFDLATNHLKMLDQKIQYAKTPQERVTLEEDRKRVSIIREGYAQDPVYRTYIELINERTSPEWDRKSQASKDDYYRRFRDTYMAIHKLPPSRDPDALIMEMLVNRKKLEVMDAQIAASKERVKEEELQPKDQVIRATGDFSYIIGKNKAYDEMSRGRLRGVETLAKQGYYDNPKNKVEVFDQEYIDRYRAHVESKLPMDVRTTLGPLSMEEVVRLNDSMQAAHDAKATWSPKKAAMVLLAERRRREEETTKKKKR